MQNQWLPAWGKIICCRQYLLEEHSLEASGCARCRNAPKKWNVQAASWKQETSHGSCTDRHPGSKTSSLLFILNYLFKVILPPDLWFLLEISYWINSALNALKTLSQGHCRDRYHQEMHPEPMCRNIGRATGRGGRIWIRRIRCFEHSWGTCCCLPVCHSVAKLKNCQLLVFRTSNCTSFQHLQIWEILFTKSKE